MSIPGITLKGHSQIISMIKCWGQDLYYQKSVLLSQCSREKLPYFVPPLDTSSMSGKASGEQNLVLICSKPSQLLDPSFLLGPMTNPPLSVRSVEPDMDAEDLGTAEEVLFHLRLLVKRPVGKSASKYNFIFRVAIYLFAVPLCL